MIALIAAAALFTNTAQVQGIAAAGATLWAATGGGLEEYALPRGERRRLYTTEDGLSSNDVRKVWHDGLLHARAGNADCTLRGGRFECIPATPGPASEPAAARRFRGARATGWLHIGKQTVVATVDGLYLDGRRITPAGQLCGTHVSALATWRGQLWAGAFDEGVCVFERGAWRSPRTPFRMVNDLHATPRGLYVAAAEGLYFTRDGRTFHREARIRERGVNGLAASSRWLFVTTPAVLYAIRVDGRDIVRRFRRPAGSTALQAVAVSGANVWLATEDTGVVRMRGERFEAFDMASGLPSSWMLDVAPARGGGVWAATLRDGAVRLASDGRVLETKAAKTWGLRLYNDGDAVLFGTQQGLDGATAPLPDPRVHALLRTPDALWIGTEGGLLASAR